MKLEKNEQSGPNIVDDMESAAFFVRLVVSSLAVMTYPFTRVNFGRDFFRFPTILGLVILWLYSGYTSPHDAIPCLIFTAAFFAMLIFHRVRHFYAGAGQNEHSRYNGSPRMCLNGDVSESTAKLVVEPFVVGGIGMVIIGLWSGSLGVFLLVSAAAGLVEHAVHLQYVRRQVQDIRDAEIGQDLICDQYDRKFGSKI